MLCLHADDARGWQCPFVLCLHPQGCLRRGVRASWLSSHGRGLGPRDALKKDSRGLSRVAAPRRGPARCRGRHWHRDCARGRKGGRRRRRAGPGCPAARGAARPASGWPGGRGRVLYHCLSFRTLCARVKMVTCAPSVTAVKLSDSLHRFAFIHQWIGKTHLRVTKPEYTHVISKAQTLQLSSCSLQLPAQAVFIALCAI